MPPLTFPEKNRSPALVIFDKDGTLIDFNYMWASWVMELACRLERAANLAVASPLYTAMGYDAARRTVVAGSPLAAHSMADLHSLTARVVANTGLSADRVQEVTDAAWFVPDPVALARPLADLVDVFSALHARGIRVAVATSDDRASTVATLRALGVYEMIDALVSADDGLANKPAPDMILRICAELGISAGNAAMVGDSVADMRAARAAGIGLNIAVLSGVTGREELLPFAHLVLSSVAVIPFVLDPKC